LTAKLETVGEKSPTSRDWAAEISNSLDHSDSPYRTDSPADDFFKTLGQDIEVQWAEYCDRSFFTVNSDKSKLLDYK